MKTVKTKEDIEKLKMQGGLGEGYIQYIEKHFYYLFECLSNEESIDEFSMEEWGYIVILEAGDDVRNLSEVGLNPEDGGLLGSIPEFVEKETLTDGREIYRVGVLYNNEYMMTFLSEAGQHDGEVEDWFREQVTKG